MSWIITGTQRYQPAALLDQFPGAAAAYSLRNLVGTSNPAVVRVRRSSDNAEQDFTAAEVSDGTLAAWVGAGNNGFVRTWYDQSGSGNNMEQIVAGNQPRIAASGVVESNLSKPSLYFDGVSMHLSVASIPAIAGTTDRYFAAVIKANDANERNLFSLGESISGAGKNLIVSPAGSEVMFRFYSGAQSLGVITSSGTNLISWDLPSPADNANLSTLYANQQPYGLTIDRSIDTNSSPFTMGKSAAVTFSEYMLGYIQELVFYSSSQSTNRAAIEANINAHYNIF